MIAPHGVARLAPLSIHAHVKDQRGLAPDYEFLISDQGEFDYAQYLRSMRTTG